ncbi:MAG: J domain-containing protein [bacterium]|nr:J domain-containing protein [bacterium]
MTHYEVLGVAPSATPEALRRAYLNQARRWHPDRPSGDSEQMRAVNEAWTTLRNPLSRRAYDRELARLHAQAVASKQAEGVRLVYPQPQRQPQAGYQPQYQRQRKFEPIEQVGFRWRWLGVVACVLVASAAALIYFALSNIDNSDSAQPPQITAPVSQARPELGDCFLKGATALIPVGCDHPNDGQLVRWIFLGATCPPPTQLHYVRSAQQAICYLPTVRP